jgi:hypothetical protein
MNCAHHIAVLRSDNELMCTAYSPEGRCEWVVNKSGGSIPTRDFHVDKNPYSQIRRENFRRCEQVSESSLAKSSGFEPLNALNRPATPGGLSRNQKDFCPRRQCTQDPAE